MDNGMPGILCRGQVHVSKDPPFPTKQVQGLSVKLLGVRHVYKIIVFFIFERGKMVHVVLFTHQ